MLYTVNLHTPDNRSVPYACYTTMLHTGFPAKFCFTKILRNRSEKNSVFFKIKCLFHKIPCFLKVFLQNYTEENKIMKNEQLKDWQNKQTKWQYWKSSCLQIYINKFRLFVSQWFVTKPRFLFLFCEMIWTVFCFLIVFAMIPNKIPIGVVFHKFR